MISTYHRIPARRAALSATLSSAPTRARRATVAGLGALLSLVVAVSPAGASTLMIRGAGDGHGVGMSQDGALGYAQHGFAYGEILTHYYPGTALGQAPANSVVRVLLHGKVHRIALETYVQGVVAAEVSADWPLAALEAQAVASRTYALTAHAGTKFDVYADTRSQVYRGVAAHTPQTNAAVADTAGQIVTYEGKPAITYFFASSGGATESVQNAFPGATPEPWLRGVADPYEVPAQHAWNVSISFTTAAARLRGLVHGSFRGIEVLQRGSSPRVLSAEILGSRGTTPITGAELEARLGLQSSWVYFSVKTSQGVKAEPDHSGQPSTPASPPVATPPAPTPPASPAPQPAGGVSASGAAAAPTSAGGTSAG
jgi:SpoIID/LytB domain protein